MNYWLLKTDPDTYSFADLARETQTTWDGVSNPQALGYLRQMKRGDRALIYHTGKEKAIVGSCTVVRGARCDKSSGEERAAVEVRFDAQAAAPVPLAMIKSDPLFHDFPLVRQSRLSVMPVPPALWKVLCARGKLAP
jgi:predicted RNA-binding protein with PUA-like domain